MLHVPQFLGHIPIYEEGALISAVLCKNVAGIFRQEISQKIRGGHTSMVMGKKVSNYIAGIIPIGPGRRYTLSIYSGSYRVVVEQSKVYTSNAFQVR